MINRLLNKWFSSRKKKSLAGWDHYRRGGY